MTCIAGNFSKAWGQQVIITNSPDEFATYIARDVERVAKVVKASGIALD